MYRTTLQRCVFTLAASFLLWEALPARAQAQTEAFQPSVSVGAGIQTSFQHSEPDGGKSLDQFSLGHVRLYLNGSITKNVSAMLNTDYDSVSNKIGVLDMVGQIHTSPFFNIWFGRFLPPSDRANLYGPFYSNNWAVYTDGIQDGYPFVFQGRDNGAAYWGDFKAGIAKIKVSVGAFDGSSATGNSDVLGAGRVQIDFWDKEDGYYLNGTYYGGKNLLAIGGASQVQSGKTASTVDFLMEKRVMGGGAFTIESEYSNYNRLGGYGGFSSTYTKSQGAYLLAAFLFPKPVGIGKIQLLGKYASAQFTGGATARYVQKTTEVDLGYLIKEFDARIFAFGKNTSFSDNFKGLNPDFWQAGVGLQFQFSKTIR
jgi:hypothetical protein